MEITDPILAKLVAEGAALKAHITAASSRLKEIEPQIIEGLGAGKFSTASGDSVTIIAPSAAIKPSEEVIAQVQDTIGDEAAFKKLFERVITLRPIKAFREVAGALLEKRVAKKIIALCEKESTPYVKWA